MRRADTTNLADATGEGAPQKPASSTMAGPAKRTVAHAVGALLVAAALVGGTLGCSSAAKSLGEAALRTAASQQAAKRFSDAGYPIKGGLTCTSNISGHTVVVHCTGSTTQGLPVTANGVGVTANHDTALKGTWTGTVAGKQVFSQNCIGPTC